MFFQGAAGLVRILLVAPLAYALLVLFLRVGGKRTLSKLNAFDLVVTVALGSTLASVITSKQLPLAEGALSLLLLIVLQVAVSWSARRIPAIAAVVRSEPRLVFHRGHYLERALRDERLRPDELLHAMRSQGFSSVSKVEAVVLETDGTLSVVSSSPEGPSTSSTLIGVNGHPQGSTGRST